MEIGRTGNDSSQGVGREPWAQAILKLSGYCGWLGIWSFLSLLLLAAGVVLINWGLGNIEARESFLALGIGLAAWGWLLIPLAGTAVWYKASTNFAGARA